MECGDASSESANTSADTESKRPVMQSAEDPGAQSCQSEGSLKHSSRVPLPVVPYLLQPGVVHSSSFPNNNQLSFAVRPEGTVEGADGIPALDILRIGPSFKYKYRKRQLQI